MLVLHTADGHTAQSQTQRLFMIAGDSRISCFTTSRSHSPHQSVVQGNASSTPCFLLSHRRHSSIQASHGSKLHSLLLPTIPHDNDTRHCDNDMLWPAITMPQATVPRALRENADCEQALRANDCHTDVCTDKRGQSVINRVRSCESVFSESDVACCSRSCFDEFPIRGRPTAPQQTRIETPD